MLQTSKHKFSYAMVQSVNDEDIMRLVYRVFWDKGY